MSIETGNPGRSTIGLTAASPPSSARLLAHLGKGTANIRNVIECAKQNAHFLVKLFLRLSQTSPINQLFNYQTIM
jgi:hypothetical protein